MQAKEAAAKSAALCIERVFMVIPLETHDQTGAKFRRRETDNQIRRLPKAAPWPAAAAQRARASAARVATGALVECVRRAVRAAAREAEPEAQRLQMRMARIWRQARYPSARARSRCRPRCLRRHPVWLRSCGPPASARAQAAPRAPRRRWLAKRRADEGAGGSSPRLQLARAGTISAPALNAKRATGR